MFSHYSLLETILTATLRRSFFIHRNRLNYTQCRLKDKSMIRPLVDIKRFDENEEKTSYSDFTVVVFRLDNEVDLHGFSGTPSPAKRKQLFDYLKPYGITHINVMRKGVLRRYKVR